MEDGEGLRAGGRAKQGRSVDVTLRSKASKKDGIRVCEG